MELDRDNLDRFIDGELSPGEMERIAAILADSPEQNAYVACQESLRNRLREGFRALDGSTPEWLIETVRSTPASWQWRLRVAREPKRLFRWLAPACATLVLGFVAGISLRPQGDLVTTASGQVIAQGALGKALDGQLASERNTGSVRIGISFRNRTGQACRTFNSGNNAGLACHNTGAWVVGMLVRQVPEDTGAVYRMAGSEMPDAVRRAVMASIRGEPFDTTMEVQAARDGWPQIRTSGH